jgi:hypothetical protein
MNVDATVWFMRVTLALAALGTGCSGPAGVSQVAPRASEAHIQNVRFGTRTGELLLTFCRGGEPETCTLTLADVERRNATEYAAPGGGSIKDASFAEGLVLAVVIKPQADAHGNHPSTIVSFSPGDAALAVRRRDAVQMRFPVEANGRLMFWRRDCRSPTERYCQHDLYEQTGPKEVTPVGPAHRFAEVDTIVSQNRDVIVNASYPADGVADGNRYLEYAGSTSAWRLAPAHPFGLARLAGDKDVLKAMAVPGGLMLLAQDESGIALFRDAGGQLERIVGLPPATEGMTALAVRDVAVSADGGHVAMIVGGSDPVQPASLFTLDLATRTWRTVDPAALAIHSRIVLKE